MAKTHCLCLADLQAPKDPREYNKHPKQLSDAAREDLRVPWVENILHPKPVRVPALQNQRDMMQPCLIYLHAISLVLFIQTCAVLDSGGVPPLYQSPFSDTIALIHPALLQVSRDTAFDPNSGKPQWDNILPNGQLFEKNPEFFASVFAPAAMGLTPEQVKHPSGQLRALLQGKTTHTHTWRAFPTAAAVAYLGALLQAEELLVAERNREVEIWKSKLVVDSPNFNVYFRNTMRKKVHPLERLETFLKDPAAPKRKALVGTRADPRTKGAIKQAPISMLAGEPYEDPRDFTLDLKKNEPRHNMVRDPTTWTIIRHDGPNHLGS